MKKPASYATWHRRGIDWCRAHHVGNETHGAAMRAYIDFENWRKGRAERFANMRGWAALGLSAVAAVAAVAKLWLG